MNTKTYSMIAALAATALLVGAFALPAMVSVAYADSNQVKNNVHLNQHNKCGKNSVCDQDQNVAQDISGTINDAN